MHGLKESFKHKSPPKVKVVAVNGSKLVHRSPVKRYRGTISSFSAGMVWTAFLSSFKCEKTISGGSRLIHWLREKSKTSLALNSSRNIRSVSPVFST